MATVNFNEHGTHKGDNIAKNKIEIRGDNIAKNKIIRGDILKEGEGGKITKDKLPKYERLIYNKLVSVSFLLKGARVQESVCKITTNGPATGFLIAKDILMTNHHVFPDAKSVEGVNAIFGYNASKKTSNSLKTVPIKEFIFADPKLDFALVTIAEQIPSFISLPSISLNYAPGQHANIIGHPNGKAKMVSLRRNEITEIYTNTIEYTSDTEPGSSGSPVFDNDWELIALHSSAGKQDSNGNWISNEGVRIDAIVAHIKKQEKLKKLLFS